MTIKLLGACMVVASGVLWGNGKARSLYTRECSLKSLVAAMGMLESEVVFYQNKLKTAFEDIARLGLCEGIFSEAAKNLGEMSAYKAWICAVEKEQKPLRLTKKDAEAVKLLANELGKSDKEQQLRSIRRVSALLNAAADEAGREYAVSAKMYRSGGACGGLLTAVLLM